MKIVSIKATAEHFWVSEWNSSDSLLNESTGFNESSESMIQWLIKTVTALFLSESAVWMNHLKKWLNDSLSRRVTCHHLLLLLVSYLEYIYIYIYTPKCLTGVFHNNVNWNINAHLKHINLSLCNKFDVEPKHSFLKILFCNFYAMIFLFNNNFYFILYYFILLFYFIRLFYYFAISQPKLKCD